MQTKTYLPGVAGRGDLQAIDLARLQQPRGEQDLRVLGHEALAKAFGLVAISSAAWPTSVERAGLGDDQVVRRDVGVLEHDHHGLAGLDVELGDVEGDVVRHRADEHHLHAELAELRRQLLALVAPSRPARSLPSCSASRTSGSVRSLAGSLPTWARRSRPAA